MVQVSPDPVCIYATLMLFKILSLWCFLAICSWFPGIETQISAKGSRAK